MSRAHIASRSRQVLREPPDLAVRSVAVAGRIEDYGVVAVAAADFPADEFHRISGNPADGGAQSPDNSALRRDQATMLRAASTCVTSAPAAAAAKVLPPV